MTGRVQGVFYRATCADLARERGLAGFIRNLLDGRVEAVFEGDDAAVDEMVAWSKEGTAWSRVDAIEIVGETPAGERAFRVTR